MPTIGSQAGIKLTLIEKLELLFGLCTAPFALAYRLYASPFTAYRWRTWKRIQNDAVLRHFLDLWNIRQLKMVSPPFESVYNEWTTKNGLEPLVEDIDDAKLCWIGPRRLDKVVIWFPGGGFAVPAGPGWLEMGKCIQEQVSRAMSKDISVAILDYSLAPEHPFPVQLRQATAALKHLLDLGVQPSNLILMGDSAGANLILQILSQILHPDPSLPSPLGLSEPLRGALFLSPFIRLSGFGPSAIKKNLGDSMPLKTFQAMSQSFLQGVPAEKRVYVEHFDAEPVWWKGVDELVQEFLVTAGDQETLFEDITDFVHKFQKGSAIVRYVVQKHGFHDEPLADFIAGDPDRKGTIKEDISDWYVNRFNK